MGYVDALWATRAGGPRITGTSSGWTLRLPNDCDVIGIVENDFASALMERYPRAAESDYCDVADLQQFVGTAGEWSFRGLSRPGTCP